MKSLLVETTPRNYDRNVNTINYGQEIVRKKLDADVMHWADLVNVRFYDIIGFNVFYPINVINMTAFLKQHDLLDKENRRQTIIAGGQGVSNLKGIIDPLVDSIFKGEIDGEVVNGHVFHRRLELDTPEMSNHERGVVELTRGCKYSCAFCEYGCKVGGPYREKPIELVKEQMLRLKRSGIGTINFMSANLGGYSDVLELIDHCLWNGIRIANTDSCLSDLTRLDELLPTMSSVRVGVESLCADTRRAIQKPSGGRSLVETMEYLFRKTNGVHMYLIYGLPNENYDEWFKELAEIKKVMSAYDREEQGLFGPIMEYDKNIRLDFSFTQFEPCVGTPLEDAPWVNFKEREEFLKAWLRVGHELGFYKKPYDDYHWTPGNFGRDELSYRTLMHIKTGGPELCDALVESFPNGYSGHAVSPKPMERFLEAINAV